MNRLFLTAVTGEICMYVMHGIKPPYNPISLFVQEAKKEGLVVKKGKLHALGALRRLYKDNNLKEHALLGKAIEHEEKRTNRKLLIP